MKAKTFAITTEYNKKNAKMFLEALDVDGKVKVVFSNVGTKSQKQRGLQFMGYEDVQKSGVGGYDSVSTIHLHAKQCFAIPILRRDDVFFEELYSSFIEVIESPRLSSAKYWHFVGNYVSTEKFSVAQMAEYLTNFRGYYIKNGVAFREPDFRGLLNF
ncbi:hypothetical protein MNBD_GAMMA01-1321 [hydrothermal vent metagenome]|uniref:Uncharacterized protein n=1 Tax=hydrothermal vent metagenome TaxID=652676 RepID=A0A3B0V7S3_9ZZZZ